MQKHCRGLTVHSPDPPNRVGYAKDPGLGPATAGKPPTLATPLKGASWWVLSFPFVSSTLGYETRRTGPDSEHLNPNSFYKQALAEKSESVILHRHQPGVFLMSQGFLLATTKSKNSLQVVFQHFETSFPLRLPPRLLFPFMRVICNRAGQCLTSFQQN